MMPLAESLVSPVNRQLHPGLVRASWTRYRPAVYDFALRLVQKSALSLCESVMKSFCCRNEPANMSGFDSLI